MSDEKVIESIAQYCISIGVDGEGIRWIWSKVADKIDLITGGR